MADGKIEIDVVLNDGTIVKGFASVKKKAAIGGAEAGASFGTSFGAAFKATAALLIAKFSFGRIINESRNFSRSIAEVNSILSANNKLTKETTQTFKNFSESFGTDATTQAKAFYNIVSAGVKTTAKQLDVLEASNTAAVAGLVNIDTAAKALVSSMNAYSASGLTAERASNDLFVAVREGQTTFGELASSIGSVASLGKEAGVSFDELTGSLAFLTKSGEDTVVVATQLRQLFASIVKPSKQAADAAKRLGIEFSAASVGKAGGFSNFIKEITVATKGNSKALSELFPNIRAYQAALKLIKGDQVDFNRILKETANSANATSLAAKELEKNFDFQLKQLESEFKNLALAIGDVFIPTLLFAIDKIKEFGRFARKALEFDNADKNLISVNKQIEKLSARLAKAKDDNKGESFFGGLFESGLGEESIARTEKELTRLKAARDRLLAETLQGPPEPPPATEDISGPKEIITSDEKDAIEDTFKSISESFSQFGSDIKTESVKIGRTNQLIAKSFINTLGRGVGNAFGQFGAALVNGENAFEAFGKTILGLLGDISIQLGTGFILQGAARIFAGDPGGGALIGAGSALAVFGGALKAIGGGGSSLSSGASSAQTTGFGGGGAASDFQSEEFQGEPVNAEPGTEVNLIVQGDILDSDQTSFRIGELLNEAFDKQGLVISNNARFA